MTSMDLLLLYAGIMLLVFGIGLWLAWVANSLPHEPRPGTKDEAAAKRPT